VADCVCVAVGLGVMVSVWDNVAVSDKVVEEV
jgi:hypothetical protein